MYIKDDLKAQYYSNFAILNERNTDQFLNPLKLILIHSYLFTKSHCLFYMHSVELWARQ